MKRIYERPLITAEQFVANEYVAACGDSGVSYKFQCNAGDRNKQYDVYSTGVEGSTTGGTLLTRDSWNSTNYYHPCNQVHETEGLNDFTYGYIVDNEGVDRQNGTKTAVVIWTEGGTNVHCTTNLDMSTWETAKS